MKDDPKRQKSRVYGLGDTRVSHAERYMQRELGLVASRVTLVGLDGASLPLIQAWSESGKLPAFSRLFQEGGWGGLRSTVPPISPSAWTSIFTGVTPAKHGIFGFVKRKEGSYTPRPIGAVDVHAPPIWRLLSERRVKSAWVHIPFVYPPEPIEGVMITGLGTPSKKSNFIYPQEMKAELLEKYPDFDVDFNEDELELSHDIKRSLPKIEKVTAASIEVFKDLRRDSSYRLVASVFRALDVVQHFKIQDADTLLPFYQRFDQLIQHCLEHKFPDEVLIVCSDHGFREVSRRFHINNWLEKLELLRMKRRPILARLGLKAETFQRVLVELGMKEMIWKIKRSGIADKVLNTLPSDDFNSGIDWPDSKAYCIGNDGGAVYLNLANREPNGIVTKGSESKAALSRIIRFAREIKDPITGRPVVTEACESNDMYKNCPTDAPDILMLESEGYTFSARYNYGGELFSEVGSRRGDHSMEGILFMHGANITPNHVHDAVVWDIAPTILYLLGISTPSHMDGAVIQQPLAEFSSAIPQNSLSQKAERNHIMATIERLRKSGRV